MNSTKKLTSLLLVAGLMPWIQCSSQLEQQHDDDNYAMSDEFIAKINSMQSSWKAGRNFDPKVTSLKDIRSLCGAIDNPKLEKSFLARYRIVESDKPILNNVNIPTEFDARKVWPNCTSIGLIRNQGRCGSCWAVTVASAISDRICIASDEKSNVQISAEDLVSCCRYCGNGCNGGWPIVAWIYYALAGLSTGGEYNSCLGCKPYSIPSHVPEQPTPKCTSECTNPSYTKPYEQDKFYGELKSLAWIRKNVQRTQLNILKYGSVSATFDVYEDFIHYTSGIYYYTAGKSAGGHAVRVIGWGEENGTPYWLVTNSWSKQWGDKGIVKFRRGTNECKIESNIVGMIPKTL